ncbi:MAG: hypothetical protein ACLT98_03135 [Eggerthellaceae bacterium]
MRHVVSVLQVDSEVVGVADTEKKRSQQMVREESAYMAPAARIPIMT